MVFENDKDLVLLVLFTGVKKNKKPQQLQSELGTAA